MRACMRFVVIPKLLLLLYYGFEATAINFSSSLGLLLLRVPRAFTRETTSEKNNFHPRNL